MRVALREAIAAVINDHAVEGQRSPQVHLPPRVLLQCGMKSPLAVFDAVHGTNGIFGAGRGAGLGEQPFGVLAEPVRLDLFTPGCRRSQARVRHQRHCCQDQNQARAMARQRLGVRQSPAAFGGRGSPKAAGDCRTPRPCGVRSVHGEGRRTIGQAEVHEETHAHGRRHYNESR